MNDANDETQPVARPDGQPNGQPSGNRWEPEAGDHPAGEELNEQTPATAVVATYEQPSRFAYVNRTRAAIGGVAAAALVAVGLSGFAVGQASAGDGDDNPGIQQVGFQQGGPGQGRGPGLGSADRDGGFGGHHDGDGFAPPPGVDGYGPGQAPGQDFDGDGAEQGSST